MTADERERRIRVRNARHATPDCLCDWCFILGRLDAERKRGEGLVSALEPLRRVALGEIRHLNSGQCPDAIEGNESRDPDCPACAALDGTEDGQ